MSPDTLMKSKNTLTKRKINDILPLTFRLMTICGLWQPYDLSLYLKILYLFYKILVLFIIITMTLSLVCVTFFSYDDIKDSLFENLFLLFTLLNGCIKISVILIRRRKISSLLNSLAEYKAENSKEEQIQAEFDEEAK